MGCLTRLVSNFSKTQSDNMLSSRHMFRLAPMLMPCDQLWKRGGGGEGQAVERQCRKSTQARGPSASLTGSSDRRQCRMQVRRQPIRPAEVEELIQAVAELPPSLRGIVGDECEVGSREVHRLRKITKGLFHSIRQEFLVSDVGPPTAASGPSPSRTARRSRRSA